MTTPEMPEETVAVPDLVPVRMLNEFTYCPRLAYLEWVQGEWADNVETLEGSHVHRNVSKPPGERTRIHDRSVKLSSAKLGLVGVLDLIESGRGNRVRPVEYKRGKRPPIAEGAWEPERVQLCAQGLLLREHGFESHEGVLWFDASRERVRVRFTEELVERTLSLLAAMRERFSHPEIPPPLEDSPKCPRCSLVSICLPDETNFLLKASENVRPIAVADRNAHPMILQEPGSKVRQIGSRFRVMLKGSETASVPVIAVSQLVLMSGTSASEPVIVECCRRGIPIVHMSSSGWLHGITRSATHNNIEIRIEQFAAARDEPRRLALARPIVAAKIRNSRVLLRRNGAPPQRDLAILERYAKRAEAAPDPEALLGFEGSAARLYWSAFPTMVRDSEIAGAFESSGRKRRPPGDPLNATVSFVTSLLLRDWITTLETIGLDPFMGFYHRSKFGKPSLALDLMEPFRPVLAESVAASVFNNGEISPTSFHHRSGGSLLRPSARKSVIEAYERRMITKVTHPMFGYQCTWRRVLEIEGRLFARALAGEIASYEPFRVR